MVFKQICLLLAGFLLTGKPCLIAQCIPTERPDYDLYTLADGLPSRVVYSTQMDARGLLWLSTDQGISRFDGYQFDNFRQFSQKFSGRIYHDEGGRLLVTPSGRPDSLEILRPGTLAASGLNFNTLTNGKFSDLYLRDDATPYVLANDTIFRLVDKDLHPAHVLTADHPRGRKLLYADEECFITLDQPGKRIIHTKGKDVAVVNYEIAGRLSLTHYDRAGNLWIAANGRLYRSQGAQEPFVFHYQFPDRAAINFVSEDHFGRLLFGNVANLFLNQVIGYGEEGFYQIPWLLGIENRIININGDDFSKEIRLGTHTGFYWLRFPAEQPSAFQRFLYDETLNAGRWGRIIRGFAADSAGGVFTHIDSGHPYWYRIHRDSLRIDSIVMRDNLGNVALQHGCGTNLLEYRGDIYGMSCIRTTPVEGHIYRYRPATEEWKRWTMPEPDMIARAILAGPNPGELLIVGEDTDAYKHGKFYRFYPERDTFVAIDQGEIGIEGYVKSAVLDTVTQTLWTGAINGHLYSWQLSSNSVNRYTLPKNKPLNASAFALGNPDDIYIGTFDNGLYHFQPSTRKFSQVGGLLPRGQSPPHDQLFLTLPSNSISALDLTPQNYLLITTFNGLVLHGPEDQTFVYTTNHGLPHDEFNTPSLFYHAAEDRYYAGGVNGFAAFSIADILAQRSTLTPCIVRFTRLDQREDKETTISWGSESVEELVIDPSVSYFSFDFTLGDYDAPQDVKYQTRLVGFDPDWTPATNNNSIRYTRLPPGNYNFQLRGLDSQGNATNENLNLPIMVREPWYRRNWFYATLALLYILGISLLDRRRTARLRRKIEYERRLNSIELRALRQQLNPHFIFNAMGAIREFILKAPPQEAAGYLDDFARLMRLFLEASRNRFTPVSGEVELLRHYVALEQLRFPGRFSVTFSIDENIDQEMEELPSLLLQPIVENAILHGLAPLDGPGKLCIEIRRHPSAEDVLICTVYDNGIGRRRAEALRAATVSAIHRSRATQILEERRALLEEDDNVRIAIFNNDIYPDRENSGTAVTLYVSYDNEPIPGSVVVHDPFLEEFSPRMG